MAEAGMRARIDVHNIRMELGALLIDRIQPRALGQNGRRVRRKRTRFELQMTRVDIGQQ